MSKRFIFPILIVLLFISFSCANAAQENFSITKAGEKGFFNMGPAVGDVTSENDQDNKKDVLKFDYSIFNGSIIGVWTKTFPDNFTADMVDAVKVGVKVTNPEQLRQVSVKLEIKGENGTQNIPLRLGSGWNYVHSTVEWNKIGKLKEIVYVVSPMYSDKNIGGILNFDLDFYKLTFLEKYLTPVKAVMVFVFGSFLALMSALVGMVIGKNRPGKPFNRDLLYGITSVLAIAVALAIYIMGDVIPLEAGFSFDFLEAALAGLLIAGLLKRGLTGKHLTGIEVLQNTLFTGFLAASSGTLDIFRVPSGWSQVLVLNNFIAAFVFIIYQISNACSMAKSNKHLKPISGILIVGIPYLFNWLLLVGNASILQSALNFVTGSVLSNFPVICDTIGRLIVVFIFNEAMINGISFATSGRLVRTMKAHLFAFFVSLSVVIAPLISDIGSSQAVASLPAILGAIISIITTMLAYAGLWGQVYLITGMILDGVKRIAPSQDNISKNVLTGMKKGMAYVAILLGLLYAAIAIINYPLTNNIMRSFPLVTGLLAGALIFPLVKTTIETFDGTLPFFERARFSYKDGTLYARGAIFGFGFAYAIVQKVYLQGMSQRIVFGLIVGLAASLGVSLLRDILYAVKKQGRVQSWRLYIVDSLLGAFIGSALAFYLDASQIPVVVEKLKQYTSIGFSPREYITYPLLNKWGRIDLGTYAGGSKLLFTESLAGVINWSIAAWLFAVNKVFMQAYFQKDTGPIKFFFSKAGLVELVNHMLYVLRWGLWMSPIIFTFLRMMPDPTWYNQDGAIRTICAIYNNITMSPDAFKDWSLKFFTYILAFDMLRILIWMDHMGLRVATLVNLSFIGMDRLDEKVARFIGPAAAQRYIPDAVKRFTTWAPLLIPFYLPRGRAWDYAWNTSLAMQNASQTGGLLVTLKNLPAPQMLILIFSAMILFTSGSFLVRSLARKLEKKRQAKHVLGNREYTAVIKDNGEAYSELVHKECDISRRSYDIIDPCGRILYILDAAEGADSKKRFWPVVGNFPKDNFPASRIEKTEDSVKIINENNGIRTTVEIRLPDEDATAELWKVTVENTTDKERRLKLVPYLEWVINGGLHDRFHTQYARLYPEMEYLSEANAILSWQKTTKSMGILATDSAPEGFLTSRMDFIGRGMSVWAPRIFDTLKFLEARDSAACPTFDPIGSLILDIPVEPKASKTVNMMIGYAKNRKTAIEMIDGYLKPRGVKKAADTVKRSPLIGHGEILPGTPQPYSTYKDDGNKIIVHTPFTPRPYDHAVSNAVHSVMVTNRGLHTSCNGNSQQNRLTPDWPDTVTKEIPTEAIYLYDIQDKEWYSPTYHPLNDRSAKHESEFGVDGTAIFRMTKGSVSTELTVFVPQEDPMGVYLLTVKNNSDQPKKLRLSPYFQMVLGFQPEQSGNLATRYDKKTQALYFENPRNIFRSGPAFVSMSVPAETFETRRGRFFGDKCALKHPFMVENAKPDKTQFTDYRQIAAFLGTLDIPARAETTVAIVLGQADTRKEAAKLVKKYKDIAAVRKSLEDTKRWWLNLMGTTSIKSNKPEFDQLGNWLKYQALAERIWARRGFYQTSGAYGFRDQLQDTINLIWINPALARKQIILHASQQFIEGDVFHWFFTLTDGRTAFSCRSHASDNPLWIAWATGEYIRTTGDDSILDEMTSYVKSEFPFAPLPKNKQGWGHIYQRSTRADTVYKHCMRSIDLVMKKRSGIHGLPLMGVGDWNDGLDEIGSEGKGESVWLGFFLYYIMRDMIDVIGKKEGSKKKEYYSKKMDALKESLESTWREDRYLRAFHDDGTEIGLKGSGVWEIDALTAAWAVMSDINFERGLTVFNTAIKVLEKDNAILLGWPALREDTKPYLGRSSKYPEGVRENGMYCHGVQWLVRAARILAEQFESKGNVEKADEYRRTAYRLWLKISAIPHVKPSEIEIYGGQPNKQAADMLTAFDPGRMIWHGYTGAAGWMLRQAFEGVVGASLVKNEMILPKDLDKQRGELKIMAVKRDLKTLKG
jgi:cyclic beta-1,2-glucan synthetase